VRFLSACNVTGDLAVTCVVAKTENQMDPSYWQKELGGAGQPIKSLVK